MGIVYIGNADRINLLPEVQYSSFLEVVDILMFGRGRSLVGALVCVVTM